MLLGHQARPMAAVRMAVAVAVAVAAGVVGHSGHLVQPAAAAALEPARAKITAALLDETVRRLLPVTLNLPAPTGPVGDGGVAPSAVPATLTELRYCGPTAQGAGKFRAAIRLTGFPAAVDQAAARAAAARGGAPSTPFIGDGECKTPLGDLGRRASDSLTSADAALVFADLEASWHPWELRVSVARFVVAGEPRGLSGWGDARHDVVAFSTAGVVVPTDLGPLVFHVSPLFASDGIELAASLGESGSSPPLSVPAPVASSAGSFSTSTDPVANAIIELPFSLANRLLHAFTAHPLPVRVGRETIDVQNASIRGSPGNVAVTALASPRSLPESARVTVTATGDDLRIGTVHGDAQLESCVGLGMVASVACSARNATRTAAATALGTSATDRYRGQLLRELTGPQELHLGVARRDLKMTGELLRVAATARGFVVGARLTPGEAAAAASP